MAALTDEELMARFQAGDVDSFAVLAHRYDRPLLHLAARYLGRREEAEEVRQEALLRAFSRAESFRPEGRFRPWIYRIALNLCRDRNRRRRRLTWLSLDSDPPGSGPGTPEAAVQGEEDVERGERALLARQMLNSLPESQRTVLILKEFEELSFREIAETLDCPESTVKSRLYRGLSALRSFVGAPEPGAEPGAPKRAYPRALRANRWRE